jgi:hypothetical protein
MTFHKPGIDLSPFGTFPKFGSYTPGVPTGGLVGFWNAEFGVTETGGAVSEWQGVPDTADQAGAGFRPVLSAGAVVFDGVNDYLTSELAELPDTGYLVALVKRVNSDLSVAFFCGGWGPVCGKIGIGQNNNRVGGNIGALTAGTFFSTSTTSSGNTYLVGMYYDGTDASLRVAGVEENNDPYTATVGSAQPPFTLGNRSDLPSATWTDYGIKAVAIYSGEDGVDFDLADIDAAILAL